jgi:hypothetical protein
VDSLTPLRIIYQVKMVVGWLWIVNYK